MVMKQPRRMWVNSLNLVPHIYVRESVSIGSHNGLSAGRPQANIRTNAGMMLIGHIGTNFNEMLIKIHTFSFKKIHLKMSGKWWPFFLGLNVFTQHNPLWSIYIATARQGMVLTCAYSKGTVYIAFGYFAFKFSRLHLCCLTLYFFLKRGWNIPANTRSEQPLEIYIPRDIVDIVAEWWIGHQGIFVQGFGQITHIG